MKKNFIITIAVVLGIGIIGAASGYTRVVFADGFARDNGYDDGREGPRQSMRYEDVRSMALGICVGQELAQQGIAFPVLEPAQQPPELDPTTQAALESAVQSCRAEMEGNGASPSPSPSSSPSIDPSPTPSPTDSGISPNPDPTD